MREMLAVFTLLSIGAPGSCPGIVRQDRVLVLS